MKDDNQEPIKSTVVDEEEFSKEDLEKLQKIMDKLKDRYNNYKD